MFKFQTLYKDSSLILGNEDSRAFVCALETFDLELIDKNYCAGIFVFKSELNDMDLLVRTLLWNPQINTLIVVGNEFKECIINFMSQGVIKKESGDKQYWLIKNTTAQIDIEVGLETINLLRDNLDVRYKSELVGINELLMMLTNNSRDGYCDKRFFFVKNIPMVDVKPGQMSGTVVRGSTVADVWLKNLTAIKLGFHTQHKSHKQYKELISMISIITARDINRVVMPQFVSLSQEYLDKIEKIFILKNSQLIIKAIEMFGTDSFYDSLMKCSLFNYEKEQIGYVGLKLVQEQQLFMCVTIPVQELYGQFFINAYLLCKLQEHLKECLIDQRPDVFKTLCLGELIIDMQSVYVDVTYMKKIDKLTKSELKNILKCDRKIVSPEGSFDIFVDNNTKEIIVKHLMPRIKTLVSTMKGKNADSLSRVLMSEGITLTGLNLFNLGREIQKAEVALDYPKLFKYNQDRPLMLLKGK